MSKTKSRFFLYGCLLVMSIPIVWLYIVLIYPMQVYNAKGQMLYQEAERRQRRFDQYIGKNRVLVIREFGKPDHEVLGPDLKRWFEDHVTSTQLKGVSRIDGYWVGDSGGSEFYYNRLAYDKDGKLLAAWPSEEIA